MVLDELSNQSHPKNHAVAAVSERFLAFFFDIVLFSPIYTLLLSQIFKKIELRYYTSPDSIEFLALALIAIFLIAVLTILFQSLFIYYFQGTPGKLVFKLKIVDYPTGGRPSLGSCFLRSGLWIVQFFFLAIPFLEIMSQRQRRAMHDRASETVVVTLKQVADGGPHPLETHFVRNILIILVSLFCVWASLVASKVYVAAVRGDFKKRELEREHYLCSAVSDVVDNKHSRLDYAIALFTTHEINEECLLSEADFAFWTNNEFELDWAYLAKAFYYKFDTDKSENYLDKVCELSSGGGACEIAKALQEGSILQGPTEIGKSTSSLTAQVLRLREMLSVGQYASYLSESKRLSDQPGFINFLQKETVKALWGSNQKEQAWGAYLNTYPHMDSADQVEMASWLCLEDVEKSCEVKDYASCSDLKSRLKKNDMNGLTTESVLALIKEKDCRKDSEISLLYFHEFFEENPTVRDLASAISQESNWGKERRLGVLRDLAYSTQVSYSVRHRAQLALLNLSNDPKDFKQMTNYLENTERKDLYWRKMANKVAEISRKNKWKELVDRTQNLESGRLPASLHEDTREAR